MEGTPFDLRKPVPIGSQLQKLPGVGFDHNFCLSQPGDPFTERQAARFNTHTDRKKSFLTFIINLKTLSSHRVYHPASGRVLEVFTSQPGIQFYTANFLDGSVPGKGGVRYGKHSSFCLETQNWPDAVNQV